VHFRLYYGVRHVFLYHGVAPEHVLLYYDIVLEHVLVYFLLYSTLNKYYRKIVETFELRFS
jgi:hypothetical protein